MILSRRCLHGLRAVLYLIIQPPERGNVAIREIAEALHMPFHFLTKILQDLAQQGVLHASRGVQGGVRLAKPATELTVKEIIEALEGPGFFSGCILGFSRCSSERPCALHDRWMSVRSQIERMFAGEDLKTLAERIQHEDLSLLELP